MRIIIFIFIFMLPVEAFALSCELQNIKDFIQKEANNSMNIIEGTALEDTQLYETTPPTASTLIEVTSIIAGRNVPREIKLKQRVSNHYIQDKNSVSTARGGSAPKIPLFQKGDELIIFGNYFVSDEGIVKTYDPCGGTGYIFNYTNVDETDKKYILPQIEKLKNNTLY